MPNTLENEVVALLREKGLTLAAAESCTGGLVAKRITDVAGASQVFLGGVVAYTKAVKTALVSVPAELIEEYGVVSEQVATSLAENIREKLGADLGIGITGVAGPGADEDGNPEGRVFVSLATADETLTRKLDLRGDRGEIRDAAADSALEMARTKIQSGS